MRDHRFTDQCCVVIEAHGYVRGYRCPLVVNDGAIGDCRVGGSADEGQVGSANAQIGQIASTRRGDINGDVTVKLDAVINCDFEQDAIIGAHRRGGGVDLEGQVNAGATANGRLRLQR